MVTFDPKFSQYVCNQLPVGLLDELAYAYHNKPLVRDLSPRLRIDPIKRAPISEREIKNFEDSLREM